MAHHAPHKPPPDYLRNVEALEALELPDDTPSMEAATLSLNYDVNMDTNFKDRTAFISGISKYVEEAQSLASLNEILEDGFKYAGIIYTWRSCSRAIPAVKSDDSENRVEIYKTTVAVLEPEVNKLKDFYQFQARAIKRFRDEVHNLDHPEKIKGFISQETLLALGKMINMFAVLDALKNMKACLNNDFSFYKRAYGFLKGGKNIDPEEIQVEREIGFFLATQNSITTALRANLEEMEHYDDVLAEVVNECASLYENGSYVLPEEKHMLLKIMAFGLYLIDGSPKSKANANIYKNKNLQLSRFDKLFKQMPIVPLFGDMQFALMSYIQMGPHWDESKWTCRTVQAMQEADLKTLEDSQYNILPKSEVFRAQRDRIVADLSLLFSKNSEGVTSNGSGIKPFDLALNVIKTLSDWTATVHELYAWKLSYPTDQYRNPESKNAEAYEKALRYNFSNEEKNAIIQIIGMVKDVARQLLSCEARFVEMIRHDIFHEIQEFVQVTLREALRSVTKKKKTKARTVLVGIRDTCADWMNGTEPDDAALKGEKDAKDYVVPGIRDRVTGPGSTQLYMLRTMLESLIDDKKKSLREDLPSSVLPEFEAFYKRSFFYTHLLHFNEVVRNASDLSQFWFREFFLELTMGSRIQFPIEMSMPWILISHALTYGDAASVEFAFYPLDLYNDSANFSLNMFKKQYLYDEVEAEVDLCFDQLIFKLSDQIFAYYKTLASNFMLDKRFLSEVLPSGANPSFAVPSRYAVLFKQRHFQLLGRSVDVNRLLAQRLNIAIKRALDVAITKFESTSLAHILEFEALIENNRIAHQLLSEYFNLDPFDELYREVNESVSALYGRVTFHVFAELCSDLVPNFCYNSVTHRFIRPNPAPEYSEGEPQRDSPPKALPHFFFGSKAMNFTFGNIHELSAGYVGQEHFASAVRLLGYGGVAMCIDEMLKNVSASLRNVLTPYVKTLLGGLPGVCKLPAWSYRSTGALGFYQLRLKEFVVYPELQTEVFHAFREIGNSIICMLLIEQALNVEEIVDLSLASPFQGIVPTSIKEGDNVEEKLKAASDRVAYMRFVNAVGQFGSDEDKKRAGQSDLLTRERLCKGLCIFDVVLERMKDSLQQLDKEHGVWGGPTPLNGIVDIDECNQFHRLWSAIQYTVCITAALGNARDLNKQYLGDGLQWGGCALIALLGQRQRFDALDFTYHVLAMWDVDQSQEKSSGVELKAFAEIVRGYQNLNNSIFSLIEKYDSAEKSGKKSIQYCAPPPFVTV